MGSLACSRSGCDNVMCRILIDNKYYLCDECAEEFKDRMPKQTLPLATVMKDFQLFRTTPKQPTGECTVEEFLKPCRGQ